MIQPVQGGHFFIEGVNGFVIYGLAPADGLDHLLDHLSGGGAQGSGAVEHRGHKGIIGVLQQQPGGGDLHIVVLVSVLPRPGQVVLVGFASLGLGGDGDITLGGGVGDLYVVGQQELGEEPGGQHLLGVALIEDAYGGALGNHPHIVRVKLGHGPDRRFKLHKLVRADVQQWGPGAHPGGAGGGVNGKDALSGVEEVGGVAGDLEGGEGAGLCVLRRGHEKLPGGVIEDLNIPGGGGVGGVQLAKLLDHHVVRGLIDKGDHHILTVQPVGAVGVFRRGSLADLPDKVPGQNFRHLVAQSLHKVLVDVAGFRGAHVGNGVVGAPDGALG